MFTLFPPEFNRNTRWTKGEFPRKSAQSQNRLAKNRETHPFCKPVGWLFIHPREKANNSSPQLLTSRKSFCLIFLWLGRLTKLTFPALRLFLSQVGGI